MTKDEQEIVESLPSDHIKRLVLGNLPLNQKTIKNSDIESIGQCFEEIP
jgi:hypothetical protein